MILQITHINIPAIPSPFELELKVNANIIKSANNYIYESIDEEYVNVLIERRWLSAVIPRSIHTLQVHTIIIKIIEHILAGKYKVGVVIVKHIDKPYSDCDGYVFLGHYK